MIKISHTMTTRNPPPISRKFILASLVVAMVGFAPLQAAPNADDLFDARARFQNQKKKSSPVIRMAFLLVCKFCMATFYTTRITNINNSQA